MSGFPALPAGWLDGLHARLDRPPALPRVPLWWESREVGSVEPEWVARLLAAAAHLAPVLLPATRGTAQVTFDFGAGVDIIDDNKTKGRRPWIFN